jgi:hypothetical protein
MVVCAIFMEQRMDMLFSTGFLTCIYTSTLKLVLNYHDVFKKVLKDIITPLRGYLLLIGVTHSFQKA